MTLSKWRTTKIPSYYFNEIEEALTSTHQYVSVSEFIRTAIEEKLEETKTSKNFLLLKDFVFTETRIKQIHEVIAEKFYVDEKGMLKENIHQVIDQSLDINMISFLAKFMKKFAEYHPFNDGNKRTLLITVDIFLRLNGKKLKLQAKKETETEDELFFWHNSTQQKTIEQIKKFIKQHLQEYTSKDDVEKEITLSIEENKMMLEKLSR